MMEIKFKTNTQMDEFISYLMVCRNVLHAMHLKTTGAGSDAVHRALQKAYEGIGDAVDFLSEQYQGATGKLIVCVEKPYKKINNIEETIEYLKEIKEYCTKIQNNLPYSEIINSIDELKSKINVTLYKLIFLK